MRSRNAAVAKWVLYGLGTALLCLLQNFLLQRIVLLGVFPFLFPVLVSVFAVYEGPTAGAVYGLVLGILCDLTIAAPIPCFYTLIFPLAGFLSALLSQGWISAGFFCCLTASALSFLLTDAFHALILALTGKGNLTAILLLTARETAVTLLFVLPVFLLFRSLFRRCRLDD